MADMLMAATLETSHSGPETYKQAIKLPDSAECVGACGAEVASLVENGVFQIIDRPSSKPVITSKWVFKKKKGLSGAIEKYKARVVAKGLCYKRRVSTKLWGYCDASHLTCPDTGRSRADFVFLSARGAISWQSKLVGNASLSSCESEYMALAMAGQEASFLRQLQIHMEGEAGVPTLVRVYLDSQPESDIVAS